MICACKEHNFAVILSCVSIIRLPLSENIKTPPVFSKSKINRNIENRRSFVYELLIDYTKNSEQPPVCFTIQQQQLDAARKPEKPDASSAASFPVFKLIRI